MQDRTWKKLMRTRNSEFLKNSIALVKNEVIYGEEPINGESTTTVRQVNY